LRPAGDSNRIFTVTVRAAPLRFSLPEWVERALALAMPGRPLAPTPEALRRAASLCPATAGPLLTARPERSWAAPWTDAG
jgi:hypothetical protein